MNAYCTLFDSGFLPYGLVLRETLARTGEPYHLYVVCMDNQAASFLEQMCLSGITIILLSDVESPELLAVKSTRSRGEYCWTCTPHVIRYCLEHFGLDEVTYLDSDLCFFSRPGVLLEEFRKAEASILLTEHRFAPPFDMSAQKGKYCVQFMTFRNDRRGLVALDWWGERCLEWCYDRNEPGRFGDQKYLDDWTERFEGVHVLQHRGGGVAPWNIQMATLVNVGGHIMVNGTPLVFYHFHNFRPHIKGGYDLGQYPLAPEVIDTIYRPYATLFESALGTIRCYDKEYRPVMTGGTGLVERLRNFHRRFRGVYNVYPEL